MQSLSLTPEQATRINVSAEILGLTSDGMAATVIEAGLLAIERGMVKNTEAGSTPMSKKQHLVFGLLKDGKSVKEIASELQLGEPSVRTHIARIKNKMNCPDILELRMRTNSPKAMTGVSPE